MTWYVASSEEVVPPVGQMVTAVIEDLHSGNVIVVQGKSHLWAGNLVQFEIYQHGDLVLDKDHSIVVDPGRFRVVCWKDH